MKRTLRRLSWIITAGRLSLFVLISGTFIPTIHAQVPGICTAPDGSEWLEVPSILAESFDSWSAQKVGVSTSAGAASNSSSSTPASYASALKVAGQENHSHQTNSTTALPPLPSNRPAGTSGATATSADANKLSLESRRADEAILRKWLLERTNQPASSTSQQGYHPSLTPEIANRLGLPPTSGPGGEQSVASNTTPNFVHPHAGQGTSQPTNWTYQPEPGATSSSQYANATGIPAQSVSNSTARNLYQHPHAEMALGTQNLPAMHSASAPFNPHSYNPHRQASIRLAQGDDDLLGGGDALTTPGANQADPLSGMGPDAAREQERAANQDAAKSPEYPPGVDPHWEVFANDRYPSAIKCAKCHQQIYDEWRVSAHAYSAISPMFNRFEQKITELTRGTVGTFCMRCHAPVATQMDYPRDAPMFQGAAVFREGITCIACHRVVERYGRVNGERRIEPGSEFDPVVGNLGGDGVQKVLADRENYKVKTDPNDKRALQPIHQGAIQFEQLSDSSFCAGCHQVVVQPGIALEIVYQQYRQGPACKKGVSCQDCHMGAVPGKALGYTESAAAVVNEKAVNTTRKHANHVFYGPSVPLAHPGLFPHNEKALRWSPDAWLQFDHRQDWGRDQFENAVRAGQITVAFPEVWKNPQERRDARKVLDENQKLLDYKRKTAEQVLENGSKIDGPFFGHAPSAGKDLTFHYVVTNTSEGHNMPSGSLGAQPQLWLNVVLIGPNGQRLWESGDLDSNGDLRDLHSLDVRANRIPRDSQLVNFQTKFLITNAKGTEREMYLPVNVDIDPLPFFRPGTVPYTVLNHPPLIRMEAHSIPPLDSRTAKYKIPAELLKTPGTYRLSVRMRSRVEPPYFLLFCDGTPDMLNALNESILDVHPYSTEFVVR